MALEVNSNGIETGALITPQRPIYGGGLLKLASTNRYAPTGSNLVQIIPALTKGGRITQVTAIATDIVTASEIQLYIYDGTVYHYIRSRLMAAMAAMSNTALNTSEIDFGYSEGNALLLGFACSLWMGTAVAHTNGISANAWGGAYV